LGLPDEQQFSSAIRPPDRQDYSADAAAAGRRPGELGGKSLKPKMVSVPIYPYLPFTNR
jgi:hypothetical protein